jgi:hypothetical protein
MSKSLPLIVLLTIVLVGCDVPDLEKEQAQQPAAPVAQSAQEQPTQPVTQEPTEQPAEEPTERAAASTNPNEPPAVTSEAREVTALDPKKGKLSREAGGYLGAVAASRFYAEHAMIFNNMNYALKLYQAERGEYPKSHEEFKEQIIQANQIVLPELDPGVEYIYDPADHKLKIWRPADAESAPVALEQEQ